MISKTSDRKWTHTMHVPHSSGKSCSNFASFEEALVALAKFAGKYDCKLSPIPKTWTNSTLMTAYTADDPVIGAQAWITAFVSDWKRTY